MFAFTDTEVAFNAKRGLEGFREKIKIIIHKSKRIAEL